MSNKKYEVKIDRRNQDAIIKKQLHQLHINLKRGLLTYIILFFMKIRPHYSLEIQRKMSRIGEGHFKIEKNVVYDNLQKLERKGILGSYLEKSNIGAKRKYYYLTKFGERLFEQIVFKALYPLIFMFSTIMDNRIGELGIKRKISKKELNKLHNLINEEINK